LVLWLLLLAPPPAVIVLVRAVGSACSSQEVLSYCAGLVRREGSVEVGCQLSSESQYCARSTLGLFRQKLIPYFDHSADIFDCYFCVAKANPGLSLRPPPRILKPPEDTLVADCETRCALELGIQSKAGLLTHVCRQGNDANVCDAQKWDTEIGPSRDVWETKFGPSEEVCNCMRAKCQKTKISCAHSMSLAETRILAQNEPVCCHSPRQASQLYVNEATTTNERFHYFSFVRTHICSWFNQKRLSFFCKSRRAQYKGLFPNSMVQAFMAASTPVNVPTSSPSPSPTQTPLTSNPTSVPSTMPTRPELETPINQLQIAKGVMQLLARKRNGTRDVPRIVQRFHAISDTGAHGSLAKQHHSGTWDSGGVVSSWMKQFDTTAPTTAPTTQPSVPTTTTPTTQPTLGSLECVGWLEQECSSVCAAVPRGLMWAEDCHQQCGRSIHFRLCTSNDFKLFLAQIPCHSRCTGAQFELALQHR
jgi:hypothetical protein